MADPELGEVFLASVVSRLRADKDLADRAIAQCDLAQLKASPAGSQNSAAVVMKHLAGNMRSRFTDYLTSDGEKPWRHRDQEFVDDLEDRAALVAVWEDAWALCFETIEALTPADLTRTVTVRREPHTVVASLHRHMTHAGYHVGQIVTLAKLAVGDGWQTLTVPVGGSEALNRAMGMPAAEGEVMDPDTSASGDG